MSRVVYPRVKITLSNGTYKYSSLVTKRKVAALYSRLTDNEGVFDGVCYVYYAADTHNAFDFKDKKDFEEKVGPCLEKDLMDELTGSKEG